MLPTSSSSSDSSNKQTLANLKKHFDTEKSKKYESNYSEIEIVELTRTQEKLEELLKASPDTFNEKAEAFLKARWEYIQYTNLAYPYAGDHPISDFCIRLAKYLAQDTTDSYYKFLMPSLEVFETVNRERLDEHEPHEYVLSDSSHNNGSCKRLILIADCLNTAFNSKSDINQDKTFKLYHTSYLELQPNELSDTERARVINANPVAFRQFEQAKKQLEGFKDSLYLELKLLVQDLKGGSVNGTDSTLKGQEMNAGLAAYAAVERFNQVMKQILPAQKARLMTLQATENGQPFSYYWKLFVETNSNYKRNSITFCVNLIQQHLNSIIEAHQETLSAIKLSNQSIASSSTSEASSILVLDEKIFEQQLKSPACKQHRENPYSDSNDILTFQNLEHSDFFSPQDKFIFNLALNGITEGQNPEAIKLLKLTTLVDFHASKEPLPRHLGRILNFIRIGFKISTAKVFFEVLKMQEQIHGISYRDTPVPSFAYLLARADLLLNDNLDIFIAIMRAVKTEQLDIFKEFISKLFIKEQLFSMLFIKAELLSSKMSEILEVCDTPELRGVLSKALIQSGVISDTIVGADFSSIRQRSLTKKIFLIDFISALLNTDDNSFVIHCTNTEQLTIKHPNSFMLLLFNELLTPTASVAPSASFETYLSQRKNYLSKLHDFFGVLFKKADKNNLTSKFSKILEQYISSLILERTDCFLTIGDDFYTLIRNFRDTLGDETFKSFLGSLFTPTLFSSATNLIRTNQCPEGYFDKLCQFISRLVELCNNAEQQNILIRAIIPSHTNSFTAIFRNDSPLLELDYDSLNLSRKTALKLATVLVNNGDENTIEFFRGLLDLKLPEKPNSLEEQFLLNFCTEKLTPPIQTLSSTEAMTALLGMQPNQGQESSPSPSTSTSTTEISQRSKSPTSFGIISRKNIAPRVDSVSTSPTTSTYGSNSYSEQNTDEDNENISPSASSSNHRP